MKVSDHKNVGAPTSACAFDEMVHIYDASYNMHARHFAVSGYALSDTPERIELTIGEDLSFNATLGQLIESADPRHPNIRRNETKKWSISAYLPNNFVFDHDVPITLTCHTAASSTSRALSFDVIVRLESAQNCAGRVKYSAYQKASPALPSPIQHFIVTTPNAAPKTTKAWFNDPRSAPERGIAKVSGAYFSNYSLIWEQSGFLVKEGFRGYPHEHDARLRITRDEAHRMLHIEGPNFRVLDTQKVSQLQGRYLHICCRCREPFGHWILEYLTRLWCVPHIPEDVKILVPQAAPKFIFDHLFLMGLADRVFRYDPKITYWCETLFVPSAAACHGKYMGSGVREFLDFFWTKAEELNHFSSNETDEGFEKIYIARSDVPGKRFFHSEQEIVAQLKARGFKIISPGTLSEREKITIFAHAKIVVGPIGSGLANLLFARAKPNVLVLSPHLLPDRFVSDLSAWVDMRVSYAFGESFSDNEKDSWSAPWKIEIPPIIDLIDDLINSKQKNA